MRGRIPLFALLASSLTFLASLFLPWRETTLPSSGGVQELLNQFSGDGREYDGWVTGVGDVAALLVVAIVVATIVALRRPQLAARLPIGRLAVALGYFAVALAVTVHMLSELFLHAFTGRPASTHASWAYGAYLGLASAGIALLSGLAYRRSDLLRPREAADVVACVLGIALLVSFLLPWVAYGGLEGSSAPRDRKTPLPRLPRSASSSVPVCCSANAEPDGVCPPRLRRRSSPGRRPAPSQSAVHTGMGPGSALPVRSCSLRSRPFGRGRCDGPLCLAG